jgi:hypothetical protein
LLIKPEILFFHATLLSLYPLNPTTHISLRVSKLGLPASPHKSQKPTENPRMNQRETKKIPFDEYLATNPSLKQLSLYENIDQWQDLKDCAKILSQATCARTLTDLDLSLIPLTLDSIHHIAQLTNLTKLKLDHCFDEDEDASPEFDNALLEMSKQLTKLTHLSMYFSPITTPTVKKLVDNLDKLKVLDLSGCGGEGGDYVDFYDKLKENGTLRRGFKFIHKTKF